MKYRFSIILISLLTLICLIPLTGFAVNNNAIAAAPNQPKTLQKVKRPKKPKKTIAQTNLILEKTPATIPILMYHYIRDYHDPKDPVGVNLSVAPAVFRQQLDYIQKQGYHPITFFDLQKENIPDKPIILTFDDGYQDFYDNALPELSSRHLTAVNFVIANMLDGYHLTKQEIAEIAALGIEIGSHTLSHPDLSKLSKEKAVTEIEQSKKELEDLIGQKIISFCYPSGRYNAQVLDLVKKAGYVYATTTHPGPAVLSNPYELARYRIENGTKLEKLLK